MPITMVGWYKPVGVTGDESIISIGKASTTDHYRLWVSAGACYAYQKTGVGTAQATVAGVSAGAWQFFGAIFASATDRRAFLGATRGSNTDSLAAPATPDRTSIGRRVQNSAGSQYANGIIGEAAIWDVVLSDADMALLAGGTPAGEIQSDHLIWWRLRSNTDPEPDEMESAYSMAVVGADFSTDDPPVFAAQVALAATQAQIAVLLAQRTFLKTLTATQAQAAALHAFLEVLTATQAQIATLLTHLVIQSKVLSTTQAQTATLGKIQALIRTLSATLAQTGLVYTDSVVAPSSSDTSLDVLTTDIPGRAQPYHLDWTPQESIQALNTSIADRLRAADDMFEELYHHTQEGAAGSTVQVQPWSVELDALSSLLAYGILVRNGVGGLAARRLIAGSGVTITNPSGTSGDPTISVSGLDIGSDVQAWAAILDAIAALASAGLVARTGAGTVAVRTLTAGSAKLAVTNGAGTAGNPTVDLGSVASTDLSNGANLPLLNANNVYTGTGDTTFAGNEKFATTQNFSWNTKDKTTVYQAASDGFATIYGVNSATSVAFVGYSDSSNPPTTTRAVAGAPTATYAGLTLPVRKGDYYKIVVATGDDGNLTHAMFWVPLGTAG